MRGMTLGAAAMVVFGAVGLIASGGGAARVVSDTAPRYVVAVGAAEIASRAAPLTTHHTPSHRLELTSRKVLACQDLVDLGVAHVGHACTNQRAALAVIAD